MSAQREIEDRRSSSRVRCLGMDLPIFFWPFCMRLLPHVTTATVTVEDGTTAARSLPLHRHCNHCLQPCHHPVCWRGPRPLPLTGWLTDRWNPWTLTTLRGVIGWCRVFYMVGLALTGLHRPKGLHHQAISGGKRRRNR
jgi:hypothetical protein